jgi:hypothetical protein
MESQICHTLCLHLSGQHQHQFIQSEFEYHALTWVDRLEGRAVNSARREGIAGTEQRLESKANQRTTQQSKRQE